MKGPGEENELSRRAREMKIPCQYDNTKNYGKKSKIVARKIKVCAKGDEHKCYGSRAIMTKESKMTFVNYLLYEGSDDITMQPEKVVKEIKSNIRKGAVDLAQKWANALELAHKAYQVSNVRRPTPDQKGAWHQYEDIIKYAVQQLTATRGINGDWRMSTVLVREYYDQGNKYSPATKVADSGSHIGTHRFFVEIPGHVAVEIDGKNMDEIIESMTNKLRRHGAKVRIEERSKYGAKLTIWVNDIKRDRITIKDIS